MTSSDPDRMDHALVRRLQAALTAGPEELFQVLQDPAMEVLRAALKNRHLHEEHLLILLKRRDLSEDLLKAIGQMEAAEKSHRLKVALARNPSTPTPAVLGLLPQLYLFELLDLCLLPGTTPDQRLAAERQILRRLPTTPLGNRITLARRGTSALVGELLKEGDPPLVEICLNNPRLRESAVLQFLNGSRGTAETISIVARHPRWKHRPNLRLALLKNSRTPPIWYTLFLPQLKSHELKNMLLSRHLALPQRKRIKEELKRRGGESLN